MTKRIAEQANKLSIFWLKKNGYLHKDFSINSGGIYWTRGYSEDKSSIGFSVKRNNWGEQNEETYIQLQYTYTNYRTEEKEAIDYKIELITTPCNYGRKRHWFVCPIVKNGQYCGRRVGVLYQAGKYFGCRHCGDIAYDSQMQSGRYKGFVSIPDVERAEKEVKRYYYRGKPTRKYRRVMRLEEKFEKSFLGSAKWLLRL